MSSVEKFRSDLKGMINIGAYPGGGLINRYLQKTGKKKSWSVWAGSGSNFVWNHPLVFTTVDG